MNNGQNALALRLGALLLPKQAKTSKAREFEITYYEEDTEQAKRGDPIRETYKSKAKALARVEELEGLGCFVCMGLIFQNGEVVGEFF